MLDRHHCRRTQPIHNTLHATVCCVDYTKHTGRIDKRTHADTMRNPIIVISHQRRRQRRRRADDVKPNPSHSLSLSVPPPHPNTMYSICPTRSKHSHQKKITLPSNRTRRRRHLRLPTPATRSRTTAALGAAPPSPIHRTHQTSPIPMARHVRRAAAVSASPAA